MTGGPDDAPQAPWLIVVKRDQRDLYEELRALFEKDPRVEIILDRRAVQSPEEAAFWQERRRPLGLQQTQSWADLGFFLVGRREERAR